MATKRAAKPQVSKPAKGESFSYETFGDFTGGLWQRENDRECPRNGLLALKDAYALPTGGLRAWGTWQPMTMTGITNNSYILGIWAFGGVEPLAGIYCCTLECDPSNVDNSTFRLLRLAGTSGGTASEAVIRNGSWTTLHTITAIKAFGAWTHMTPYRFTTGASNVYRLFYNVGFGSSLGVSDTAREGIFRTDGTTAARDFYYPFPADCFGHQLALMFTAIEPGAGLTLHNQIAYTNVASDAQPTTVNAFFPLPNFSSPITWVSAVEPSDLIVAKSQVGFALIQGDITNPIQRQISFAHAVSTVRPVNTDVGLAISVTRDSVYLWTGSEMRDIGQPLLGNPSEPPFFGSKTAKGFETNTFDFLGEPSFRIASWGQSGQMAFGEYFLFAGGDYIWDERTEAWFTVSRPGTPAEAVPARFAADRLNNRIYHARHLSMQTGRQLLWWENLEEGELHRANSYTFTLPLMYSDHGFLQLRELEYYLGVFNPESKIEVSIEYGDSEGNVKTHVVNPRVIQKVGRQPVNAANQHIRIGDLPGDAAMYFKITTTLSGPPSFDFNQTAGFLPEAPMLEKVLVGTAPVAVRYPSGN